MATPTRELTGNHKRRYKGFDYEARTREPDEEPPEAQEPGGVESTVASNVEIEVAAGSPTWTTEEPVEES